MILGDENEIDDEFVQYIVDNRVDLAILIEQPSGSFEKSLRKLDSQLRYSETTLTNQKPIKSIDFKRKKVDFKLNVI